jgi:tripartite-type tricarboxylate transporter receptor subunit TctC
MTANLLRRQALRCAATALALGLGLGANAQAQDYPVRPIRMIVPFPPGGIVDVNARALAKQMSERLKTPVVIDNRPGAGGLVGGDALAKATPDGYTIGYVVPTTTTQIFLREPPFDVFTDYQPIGSVYAGPLVLTTNAAVPVKTLPEFVAYARANPGKLNFGTSSGPPALAMAMFAALAKIDVQIIDYKGAAPAMTALVGNEVQANFGAIVQFTPFLESGRVKPLAVGGDQRMAAIPNVPTMAELGYPEVKGTLIGAVMAPAGVPAPIVARLNAVIRQSLSAPDLERVLSTSGRPLIVSNEELIKLLHEEVEWWSRAAKLAGFKPI